MRENFPSILAETWRHEGGYVDNPSDPGGATKYGITITTLRDWRKRPVTKADVQALSREEASAIYRANYWAPIRGDDLPSGIDAVAFDAAVNSGVSRGAKWVQAAAGVTADGKIGPQTLAALRSGDPVIVINRALDMRLAFLRSLKHWPTFGRGWQRRVDEVRAFALHLAEGAKPAPPPPVPSRPADPVTATPDPDKAVIRPAVLIAVIAALAAGIAIYTGG